MTRMAAAWISLNLLPGLTALENVMLPLELRGDKHAKKAALEFLTRVGLEKRLTHYPQQLSGGEQQRVSIARALINDPEIILADEPTGNLDSKTSVEIMGLLEDIHKNGNTIILVTHEEDIALHAHRIVRLKDGKVESDNPNTTITSFQARIGNYQ